MLQATKNTPWHEFNCKGRVNNQIIFMRSLLYLVSFILIAGWIVGFFVYSAAGIIHVLLILAIITLLLGFVRRA